MIAPYDARQYHAEGIVRSASRPFCVPVSVITMQGEREVCGGFLPRAHLLCLPRRAPQGCMGSRWDAGRACRWCSWRSCRERTGVPRGVGGACQICHGCRFRSSCCWSTTCGLCAPAISSEWHYGTHQPIMLPVRTGSCAHQTVSCMSPNETSSGASLTDLWLSSSTCEEVGHLRVQVLQHIHGGIQKEESIIVAIQQPLIAVTVVPEQS